MIINTPMAAALVCSCGSLRTLNQVTRGHATANGYEMDPTRNRKHEEVDAVLSTYELEAGLPVTKMLGFSNKINNKINLITIIYI